MVKSMLLFTVALGLGLAGCVSSPLPAQPQSAKDSSDPVSCPVAGRWVLAEEKGLMTTAQLLDAIAEADVVLLGERHDRADEHHWQLQMMAALYGRHSDIAVGFEMFTREQQGVLDRWVAGELSEEEFLSAVDWENTWGFPAELYSPLLHFVRISQVDPVALNIERELMQRISREGWAAVPLPERHYIQSAVPGPRGYDELLDETLTSHHHGTGPVSEERKEAFRRAQQAWDRAMAEALASAAETHEGPVVAVVGRGHMEWGYGIPYQLAAMGTGNVVSLLPYKPGDPCLDEPIVPSDGLYGLPTREEEPD